MDETTEQRFSASKRLERGVIVLPEEIDHTSYEFLLDALDQGRGRELRLYCRGNGGSSDHALAMVDLIEAHGQVIGLLPGLAASSHGLVWAACARRFVYPRGRLGVHKIAWGSLDSRSDSTSLQNQAKEFALVERDNAAILAAASNKTTAQWFALMQRTGSGGLITFDAAQLIGLEMARPISELESEARAVEASLRKGHFTVQSLADLPLGFADR